jgi:DNA polymerase III sliding clamp (beta) subunit (PCNA family)
MPMERKEVLGVLKMVEPALSTKDLIAVFACLCFTEKTVTAYDDVVALQFPFNFGITGAIRGRVLIDFLSSCRAKELELEEGDGSVKVKAGRAKLDTPVLPEDDFLFKRPKMEKGDTLDIGEAFLTALGKAMISMGRDPSHPFRYGITVATISDPKPGLVFYSSDNKAATEVYWHTKEGLKVELVTVLPPRFCELLTEIGKTDKPTNITLTEEWVEAKFASGLRLFSRTVQGAELKTFGKVFGPLDDYKRLVPIPKGLDRCLERACVVAKYSKEPFTSLTIKDDKLILLTKSEAAGNVRDSITIDTHGPASEWVHPELLARALPLAESMGFVENSCILLKGKNFTHMVTVVEGAGDSQ